MALQVKQAEVRQALHKHFQPAVRHQNWRLTEPPISLLNDAVQGKALQGSRAACHIVPAGRAANAWTYSHLLCLWRAQQGLSQRVLGQLLLWWQVLECCQEALQ